MILPREHCDLALSGATYQRYIPDTDAMYGWVCGHLGDDEARPTLQYSSLCVSGDKKDRTIFQRGRVYPVQDSWSGPVLGHVTCTVIHRGGNNPDNPFWVIRFELQGGQS